MGRSAVSSTLFSKTSVGCSASTSPFAITAPDGLSPTSSPSSALLPNTIAQDSHSTSTTAQKSPTYLLEKYNWRSTPPKAAKYAFRASQFASTAEAARQLEDFLARYPPSKTHSSNANGNIWVSVEDPVNPCVGEATTSLTDSRNLTLVKARQEMAQLKKVYGEIDADDTIPLRSNITKGKSKAKRKSALAQKMEKKTLPTLAQQGGLDTGKWMWFRSSGTVDATFKSLARSLLSGPLSRLKKAHVHTLKVDCCDKTRDGEFLIALYYHNVWDSDASREVVQCVLENHGLTNGSAKTDLWSILGIVSKHWSNIAATIHNYDSLLPRDVQDDLKEAYFERLQDAKDSEATGHATGETVRSRPDERSLTGSRLCLSSAQQARGAKGSSSSLLSPAAQNPLRSLKRSRSPDSGAASSSIANKNLVLSPRSVRDRAQPADGPRVPGVPLRSQLVLRPAQLLGTLVPTPEAHTGANDSDTESEEEVEWKVAKMQPVPSSASGTNSEVFFSPMVSPSCESVTGPPPPTAPLPCPHGQRTSNLISPTEGRYRRGAMLKPRPIDYASWRWTQLAEVELMSKNVGGWRIFQCPQEALDRNTPADVHYEEVLRRREATQARRDACQTLNSSKTVDSTEDRSPASIAIGDLLTPEVRDQLGHTLWPVATLTAPRISRPLHPVYEGIWKGLNLEEKHYGRIMQKLLGNLLDDCSSDASEDLDGASQVTGNPSDLSREIRARERRATRDAQAAVPDSSGRRQGQTRKFQMEDCLDVENAAGPSGETRADSANAASRRKLGRPHKLRPDETNHVTASADESCRSMDYSRLPTLARGQEGSDEEWGPPGSSSAASTSRAISSNSRDASPVTLRRPYLHRRASPSTSRVPLSPSVQQPESAVVNTGTNGLSTTASLTHGPTTTSWAVPLRSSPTAAASESHPSSSSSQITCAAQETTYPSERSEVSAGKRREMDGEASTVATSSKQPVQWDLSGMSASWAVGSVRRPSPQAPLLDAPRRNTVDEQLIARTTQDTAKQEEEGWQGQKDENVDQAHVTASTTTNGDGQKGSKLSEASDDDDEMDASPLNWDLSGLHWGQRWGGQASSGPPNHRDKDRSQAARQTHSVAIRPGTPLWRPTQTSSTSPPPSLARSRAGSADFELMACSPVKTRTNGPGKGDGKSITDAILLSDDED